MSRLTVSASRAAGWWLRPASLSSLAFVLLFAQSAQAQPGNLTFFKNYFITGDYVVGGVNLRTQGVNGVATGTINISGVPGDLTGPVANLGKVDILGAYLFWQTVTTVNTGTDLSGAAIRWSGAANPSAPPADTTAHPIGTIANLLNPQGTAPCWSSGGGTGGANGAHKMFVYRADVLRFLPIDLNLNIPGTTVPNPNYHKRVVNGTYEVQLPDAGSGNSVPSTAGATLVVMYRDPSQSLKSIVIYNGGYTMDQSTQQFTLTMLGFSQASTSSPVAKMTHIVGDGSSQKTERLLFGAGTTATNQLELNPFQGSALETSSTATASDPAWDNRTFDVSSYLSGNEFEVTTKVDHFGSSTFDCLSWGAVIFETTVQDTDRDGLVDRWEACPPPPNAPGSDAICNGLPDFAFYNPGDLFVNAGGNVVPKAGALTLPNLKAMRADKNVQDIFLEFGYMTTPNYDPAAAQNLSNHRHLPTKAALDLVAAAFRNAPSPRGTITGPINLHFDVGNNFQIGLPSAATCASAASWVPGCAIIPASLARGGESLDETACDPTDQPCLFPGQNGTVGWKTGYKFYRDEPLSGYSQLPDQTVEEACLAAGSNCVRRFDAIRHSIFHYVLGAHSVGLVRLDDPNTPENESASGIPRSNSGIADPPGGDIMLTLGAFDNGTGTDFMQASTLMHELGHNLGLKHGGAPIPIDQPGYLPVELNCKPNYESVMNYGFQMLGVIVGTANQPVPGNVVGFPVIDYSRELLPLQLNEASLSEPAGLTGQPGTWLYRSRWYAPKINSFIDNANGLNTSPAKKHCDGSFLSHPEFLDLTVPNGGMVRINGTTVSAPNSPTIAFGIDWNGNGIAEGGTSSQDVNFSGGSATLLNPGGNDWLRIDLRQIGSRRNAASRGMIGGHLSLGDGDVGDGDVGDGDVGDGDVGDGDVGDGDVGDGDVGDGDVGDGDVGTANEADLELARSLGNSPSALRVTGVTTKSIKLAWNAPHVGASAVTSYEVYKVIGTAVTTANFGTRTHVGTPWPLVGTPAPTQVEDFDVKNNITYTYFVVATFDDGARSGVSNYVTITK